jgi:hypothetical protein
MGLFVFNRVRIFFGKEIEKLKLLVRDAYKCIHDYQLDRTDANERKLRESIAKTVPVLNVFIDHIPAYKSKYIKALQKQAELKPSDLIMCFDRAIYELHLYATLGKSGKYAQAPWSKELIAFLEERQETENTQILENEVFLTSGKPACSGQAQGPVMVILNKEDFHKIKKGSILVTTMTTPDFIEVANRISGLITDRGGIVCHAAILAREFNLCGSNSPQLAAKN